MTQYVFYSRRVARYRFPTHTNDLIMDRKDAAASEAFYVILEPGEAPPLHVHPDAEQVFFVLKGEAQLTVGLTDQETFPLKAGDFVRTPPGVHHAVRCTSPDPFVYLSIDCFTAGHSDAEPTWDSHVRLMCVEHGWDYDSVALGLIDGDDQLAPGAGSGAPLPAGGQAR